MATFGGAESAARRRPIRLEHADGRSTVRRGSRVSVKSYPSAKAAARMDPADVAALDRAVAEGLIKRHPFLVRTSVSATRETSSVLSQLAQRSLLSDDPFSHSVNHDRGDPDRIEDPAVVQQRIEDSIVLKGKHVYSNGRKQYSPQMMYPETDNVAHQTSAAVSVAGAADGAGTRSGNSAEVEAQSHVVQYRDLFVQNAQGENELDIERMAMYADEILSNSKFIHGNGREAGSNSAGNAFTVNSSGQRLSRVFSAIGPSSGYEYFGPPRKETLSASDLTASILERSAGAGAGTNTSAKSKSRPLPSNTARDPSVPRQQRRNGRLRKDRKEGSATQGGSMGKRHSGPMTRRELDVTVVTPTVIQRSASGSSARDVQHHAVSPQEIVSLEAELVSLTDELNALKRSYSKR